jgi:hypothetical protein
MPALAAGMGAKRTYPPSKFRTWHKADIEGGHLPAWLTSLRSIAGEVLAAVTP